MIPNRSLSTFFRLVCSCDLSVNYNHPANAIFLKVDWLVSNLHVNTNVGHVGHAEISETPVLIFVIEVSINWKVSI